MKVQRENRFESDRRKTAKQLVQIVELDPRCAFAIGHRSPDPKRRRSLPNPAFSGVGELDPPAPRLQMTHDAAAFPSRKSERIVDLRALTPHHVEVVVEHIE